MLEVQIITLSPPCFTMGMPFFFLSCISISCIFTFFALLLLSSVRHRPPGHFMFFFVKQPSLRRGHRVLHILYSKEASPAGSDPVLTFTAHADGLAFLEAAGLTGPAVAFRYGAVIQEGTLELR